MFVKAPAQRGQTEAIGLIYNIAIEDDPFVRQMVATPDLPEAYIQDQRLNRQVPIEVSVLAVGYRNDDRFVQALPLPGEVKSRLLALTPAADIGLAAKLARES